MQLIPMIRGTELEYVFQNSGRRGDTLTNTNIAYKM